MPFAGPDLVSPLGYGPMGYGPIGSGPPVRFYVTDVLGGPAPAEPLTKAEAKAQCRVDPGMTDDDATFDRLIAAAREFVERRTGQVIARRARTWTGDSFRGVRLTDTPIASVDAVDYLDAAGALQSLPAANFFANLKARPVYLLAALGKVLPPVASLPGSVTVTYTAGYPSAAAVPACLKQAMLLLIGHWYENRESVVVGTISTAIQFAFDALVDDFRSNSFA